MCASGKRRHAGCGPLTCVILRIVRSDKLGGYRPQFNFTSQYTVESDAFFIQKLDSEYIVVELWGVTGNLEPIVRAPSRVWCCLLACRLRGAFGFSSNWLVRGLTVQKFASCRVSLRKLLLPEAQCEGTATLITEDTALLAAAQAGAKAMTQVRKLAHAQSARQPLGTLCQRCLCARALQARDVVRARDGETAATGPDGGKERDAKEREAERRVAGYGYVSVEDPDGGAPRQVPKECVAGVIRFKLRMLRPLTTQQPPPSPRVGRSRSLLLGHVQTLLMSIRCVRFVQSLATATARPAFGQWVRVRSCCPRRAAPLALTPAAAAALTLP